MNNKIFLNSRTSQGFTLLELMMVIAILAAVILFTANRATKQSRDDAIMTTNIQMQNWLNALTNYYITKDPYAWPTDINQLIADDYMPTDTQCSTWTSSQTGTICPGKALYSLACPTNSCGANDKYRGVKLTLPSNEIAQQLVAILPGAVADGSTVSAYVPIPSVVSDQEVFAGRPMGWIVRAGIMRAEHETCDGMVNIGSSMIQLPNCPQGYEGHFIPFYHAVNTGQPQGSAGWADESDINNKCGINYESPHAFIGFDFESVTNLTTDPKNPSVKIENSFRADAQGHQLLSYVTFCVPEGHWFPAGSYLSNEGWSNEAKNASQCEGNWSAYFGITGTWCSDDNAQSRSPPY